MPFVGARGQIEHIKNIRDWQWSGCRTRAFWSAETNGGSGMVNPLLGLDPYTSTVAQFRPEVRSVRVFAAVIALVIGLFLWSESVHAHSDHAAHSTAHVTHDPADHTHFPGEDRFHEKSSHFVSVDFAHCAQTLPSVGRGGHSERLLVLHHRASGLSVRPPIRPPLI